MEKKVYFIMLSICLSVVVSAQIIGIEEDEVLGSDDFEGVASWINYNSPEASIIFNNGLGGTQNFNWVPYQGLAVNTSAGAVGGTQCLQSQWGAVTNIQNFVIDPNVIYQFEFMIHPRVEPDEWSGIHLYTKNSEAPISALEETQGIRIRFMNTAQGDYFIADCFNNEEITEDSIYGENGNASIDYYIDGYANQDYWVSLKIIFTGEGTEANPILIDYYVSNVLVKSAKYIVDDRGDNMIGLVNYGSGYNDIPKYDNFKITKMRSVETAVETMESSELEVSVFPNPATDFIEVKFDEELNKNLHYKIFDMTGKLFDSGILFDTYRVDVTSWKKGIYCLYILSDKSVADTYKFIKK